jgi:hypothetical protein
MSTALVLFGWVLLTGLAGWRPSWLGRRIGWPALGLTLLTVLVSEFWQTVTRASLSQEAAPLAGPEEAYLSVWILVLLPILRRRLDARALGATLLSGLAAAAAFGLVLDSAPLIQAGFASTVAWLEPADDSGLILTTVIHALLAFTGLAMRQLMNLDPLDPERLHWDYPIWYFGLIAMHQAATT